jgi:selenocysteine lyase/cysteine desulfurase
VTLSPPDIDPHPDVSRAALQALRGDFLYFQVAGSGPTFPIAALRLPPRLPRKGGPIVVTTAEEHGSALMPVFARRQRGDRVVVLPHRSDDSFLDALRHQLSEGAAALIISLVSCRTGKVMPVGEAVRMAHDAGATVIVDCAQALGQIRVDVRALGADAYAFLGYKWLHGPLGVGALWVNDLERFDALRLGWRSQSAIDLEGHITLKPDASRFEIGTVDVAAFVGLRQTLAVHRTLGATVGQRIRALRARLLERVRTLPFELLSRPEDPTGIVVVALRGGSAADLVARMWSEERIVVKHMADPGIDAIRISFWALHDDADIDRLAEAFAKTLAVAAH